MQIARVIGTVVATQKHRKFEGAKLLLVQPLNMDDTPRGTALLAVDGVGGGGSTRDGVASPGCPAWPVWPVCRAIASRTSTRSS